MYKKITSKLGKENLFELNHCISTKCLMRGFLLLSTLLVFKDAFN